MQIIPAAPPTPNPMTGKPGAENPLWNILFNVLLPVVILNKLSHSLGPATALVLALVFPVAYGLWDLWSRKKINYFSILGILHVLVTGTLVLMGLTGIWFAVKEAFFPALIGIFVLASSWTTKPLAKTLFMNPNVMNLPLIQERTQGKEGGLESHLRKSTQVLSLSFFFSAIANYVLALKVFSPLAEHLSETERAVALNEQVALMTQYSFAVIFVPSMICMGLVLWYMIHGLRRITGVDSAQDLFVAQG